MDKKTPSTPYPEEKPPGSLADPAMLDKIDQLFAYNVGHYIELPQVVVIGDQSSGKSSVLEGLTNLPFPRDSGLCTKFATHITFRRSKETKITIHILPGKTASIKHAETVRGWSKVNLKSLDKRTFTSIIQEVHTVMGLTDQMDGVTPPTFSDDVLSLEICGPKQEHLSIIDVPGIFKKTTQGVTTKSDIDLVRSMVLGYMKNSRSVMLAVIPANVDIATQEILEMAEEVDPDGQRTLGVLTKPDLVDKGAECSVVDLIEGRKHRLALGWNLVRNSSQQELLEFATDRHAVERNFFMTREPWNNVDKERVGISALQVRLREVLGENIRREFPKVKSDLAKKLKECKSLLAGLGPKRDTMTDQSRYLVDIATRFQATLMLALTARYGGSDAFDQDPTLRFATGVVFRNDSFSQMVEEHGFAYRFNSGAENPTIEYPSGVESMADSTTDEHTGLSTRLTESTNDIEDVLHEKEFLSPSKVDIMAWLRKVYDSSRGFEIGTFNSAMLALLWKSQSEKWDSIALGYISDVIAMAHGFFNNLLRQTCPDQRVRIGLTSVLLDGQLDRYKKAIDQVKFILQVEKSGNPITLNHYFNDNLEKCRYERMKESMAARSITDCKHGTVVRLADVTQNHSMSNVEHTIQDLHDILQSYSKVARKRFVDTVCMQATDHHLISGPDTPLKLLSPDFVINMTQKSLEEVAGEDPRQKRKRKQLEKEIEDLEKGKKILI